MQQRSEDTRARIQTAAADLFSREGYDASGVAEICAAAGVSKGAFYHHYSSKQALFLALLDSWLVGIEEELQINATERGGVPAALLKMAGRSGEVFQSAERQFRLILEFWVQASRKPEIWKAAVAPYRHYQALFTAMLVEGQREGSLGTEFDPEDAARVIAGMAMGLLLQAFLDPSGAVWEQVTRAGMEIILKGMQRREP